MKDTRSLLTELIDGYDVAEADREAAKRLRKHLDNVGWPEDPAKTRWDCRTCIHAVPVFGGDVPHDWCDVHHCWTWEVNGCGRWE